MSLKDVIFFLSSMASYSQAALSGTLAETLRSLREVRLEVPRAPVVTAFWSAKQFPH